MYYLHCVHASGKFLDKEYEPNNIQMHTTNLYAFLGYIFLKLTTHVFPDTLYIYIYIYIYIYRFSNKKKNEWLFDKSIVFFQIT